MTRVIQMIGMGWLLAVGLVGAVFAGPPQLVVQVPEATFSPQGFDDNDNLQVVVAGKLENTCYKVGPIEKRIDLDSKKIVLKDQAYFYDGSWCLQILVPYFKTVDLGPLPTGVYEVVVEGEGGELKPMGTLPVAKALSSGPDESLYAPVRDVIFNADGAERKDPYLTLRGVFPNTCMGIQEIRTVYTSAKTVEVLPIAEVRKDADCKEQAVPFELKVTLDRSRLNGAILFHTRALNGQSINQVVEF